MNRSKIREFFDFEEYENTPIHVIGCGAVGSAVCEGLARLGATKLNIYDFDTVSAHNITNQMFRECDINQPKIDAIRELTKSINSDIVINRFPQGWTPGTKLNGIVILCVDNIDIRRQIITENKYNFDIEFYMDFRMRLTDAQFYCARNNSFEVEQLLNTMDFTHEEAAEATPTSACGTTLSVFYTPRTIVNIGLTQMIGFLQKSEIFNVAWVDMVMLEIDKFTWKKRQKKDKFLEGLDI